MNTNISVICCLMISLLISGCGAGQLFGPTLTPTSTSTPTGTPTPSTGTIIGKVLWSQDSITDKPFPASIDLYKAQAADSGDSFSMSLLPGDFQTKTDSSGSYSIAVLKPGNYKMKLVLDFLGEYAIDDSRNISFEYPEIGAPWIDLETEFFSRSGEVGTAFFVMSSVFEVKSGDVLQLDIKVTVR